MAQMKTKWIILCSTAIAAVYSAGYLTTETEASMQDQPQYAQSNPLIHNSLSAETSTNTSSSPSGRTSLSPNNKQLYKNGTYSGTGRNRRGSIEVAVTVLNNKITDVEISNFRMHYSESDVVGLPKEVLQKQSAQVKNVSGATYSTEAFKDAIQDALDQAHNA